jgi:hypothetical protein
MQQVTVSLFPDYEAKPIVVRVWAFRSYQSLKVAIKSLMIQWMSQTGIVAKKKEKAIEVSVEDVYYKEGERKFQIHGEETFAPVFHGQTPAFIFYVTVKSNLGESSRRTFLQRLYRINEEEWKEEAARQAKDPRDRVFFIQQKLARDFGFPTEEEVEVECRDGTTQSRRLPVPLSTLVHQTAPFSINEVGEFRLACGLTRPVTTMPGRATCLIPFKRHVVACRHCSVACLVLTFSSHFFFVSSLFENYFLETRYLSDCLTDCLSPHALALSISCRKRKEREREPQRGNGSGAGSYSACECAKQ